MQQYGLTTVIWLGVAILGYSRMLRARRQGKRAPLLGLLAGFAFGYWVMVTLSLLF